MSIRFGVDTGLENHDNTKEDPQRLVLASCHLRIVQISFITSPQILGRAEVRVAPEEPIREG